MGHLVCVACPCVGLVIFSLFEKESGLEVSEESHVWQGCITYASLPAEVEHLCQLALSCGVEAVGFDIEWRVTYRHAICRPTSDLCS